MASIIDAFNDAFGEEYALVKFFIYSLPVFVSSYSFFNGNSTLAIIFALPSLFLLCGLLTCGINNVRSNRQEILTFNIILLLTAILRFSIAIIPQILIFGIIGFIIVTYVTIPLDYPYVPIIFKAIVWSIILSIIITAFLSFAKKIEIIQAYNYKIISESAIDVLVSLLFLIPQLAIGDTIIVGVVWYFFFFFKISVTNPLFILYCSMVVIFNISVISDYFAQASYELIKENDNDYTDNYKIQGVAAPAYNTTRKPTNPPPKTQIKQNNTKPKQQKIQTNKPIKQKKSTNTTSYRAGTTYGFGTTKKKSENASSSLGGFFGIQKKNKPNFGNGSFGKKK